MAITIPKYKTDRGIYFPLPCPFKPETDPPTPCHISTYESWDICPDCPGPLPKDKPDADMLRYLWDIYKATGEAGTLDGKTWVEFYAENAADPDKDFIADIGKYQPPPGAASLPTSFAESCALLLGGNNE